MADRNPADVLREQYRRLSDEELVDRVATGETEYTEVAGAVLQEDVSRRHLVATIEPLGPPNTPEVESALDRWMPLGTRNTLFAVIGTIGFLISLWRFASGDAQDAAYGLGLGLFFWYNVLLKPRGPKRT